ncbi:MAG TPA: BTAD domain-containing putative transcriptional regulator [Ktedonosporobacter sp.]|jgi:DNA-binding SARP family transcriptional activator|nr:BTAD domain-containing putative transcriptional regulator [Ktedonosporobacter sp.]
MQVEQDLPASVVVRIYLFGPLEIWKKDPSGAWKLVPKDKWKNSKPARAVFKRLLVQPGRRLSRSTIEDDVCSESDNFELSTKNVYNAISLIRGIIGKPLVTCWEAAYEIAAQTLVWTDLDACAVLLKEAENRGQGSSQAVPFLEQAVALLERGELLEGESGKWCYAFRKRAEDLFRQARLWLAESYEAEDRLWQAGEQYRAMILSDPSYEDALQQWLEMLVRHGKRQDALKCYRDMKEFVEAQGFPLSPEVEQAILSLNRHLQRARIELSQIVQRRIDNSPTKDTDIIRRQLLETSVHAAEIAPLLPLVDFFDSDILERLSQALMQPLRLDETTFQYLEICTRQFWYNRQSAVFSSRDLYRPVYAHLQKMIALLEGSLLPTERTRLCSLLSQTAQLLGELSLDMGHYGQGKAFHQAALAAAQEAEDHFLTVVSWGRISLACIYGKSFSDALTSIQTARSLAEKHSTPMIQGWLAAIEAEIQANLSQANLCLQALEDAECFDNQPVSPLESYLVRFDRSLLGGYQGVCFRVLSHPEHNQASFFLQKAQNALEEALVSLDSLFLQRKPTLLADLAVVSIYQQNIEEACTLISQAATLATQLHLHKVTQRLGALRKPLSPWKELASVKILDAHLAFLSSQGNEPH